MFVSDPLHYHGNANIIIIDGMAGGGGGGGVVIVESYGFAKSKEIGRVGFKTDDMHIMMMYVVGCFKHDRRQ
jgi:hypothetical protein